MEGNGALQTKELENSRSLKGLLPAAMQGTHRPIGSNFGFNGIKIGLKKKQHQQMSLLCMTLMEKALDVLSTPLTLAVQT